MFFIQVLYMDWTLAVMGSRFCLETPRDPISSELQKPESLNILSIDCQRTDVPMIWEAGLNMEYSVHAARLSVSTSLSVHVVPFDEVNK